MPAKTVKKSIRKATPKRRPKRTRKKGPVGPLSTTVIRFKNGPGPTLLKKGAANIPMHIANGGIISPETEYTFSMEMDSGAPHASVNLDVKAYFGWIVVDGNGESRIELSATPVDAFFYQNTGYYDGNETIALTRGNYVDKDFKLKADTFEEEEQGDTLLVILGHKNVSGAIYSGGIMYTVNVTAAAAKKKKAPAARAKKAVRKKTAK